MRRMQTEPVGDIVRKFMRLQGIETPYNEYKIISSWREVMGDGIANYTGNLFIKGQILHAEIKSPVLKHELGMSHKALAQKLNQHVGAQVLADINFY